MQRDRAVQIELDEVRSMIVSGLADPQSDSPLVGEQYRLAARACCSLARTFLSDGYDVTVDDFETPSGFAANWEPYLSDLDWSVLVIRPSLDVTLNRNNLREKSVKKEIIEEQHSETGRWPYTVQIDTTGMTIEESVRKVSEVLDSKN